MAFRGTKTENIGFAGGLASNIPTTLLQPNQALSLSNVVVMPGEALAKRQGDTKFNASPMVSSSTPVQGLGYWRSVPGTDALVAVTGTKIFSSTNLSGTMTDRTGSLTITTGQDAIWTMAQMNNYLVGCGGPFGTPDEPWAWSGSGNAVTLDSLGDDAPIGEWCFQSNNHLFIGPDTTNRSRINWSGVANIHDWTSTSSGFADIWNNDGDYLVGAAVLNVSQTLLFKQNSIHLLQTQTPPFPTFPLFNKFGACGKKAIVTYEGMVYFITPQARMKATDGTKVYDFPPIADDQWNGLSKSRLQYIHGQVYQGVGFRHIIWVASNGSSTTQNFAIVWDLDNQCWLTHTTGFKANVSCIAQDYKLFMGHYDGTIYQKDTTAKYTDDSEASPGAIDGLWTTGWMNTFNINQYFKEKILMDSFHPRYITLAYQNQTSGNLQVNYGFDFSVGQLSNSFSMVAPGGDWDQGLWDVMMWGGQTDAIQRIYVNGRGNVFQITFRNNIATQTFVIHSYEIAGKDSAQKEASIP